MDASASKVDVENTDLYGFLLKFENTEFPIPLKQKTTVIKYTKLPEFDFESKTSWAHQSYTLQPRLRRIITVEEPKSNSTRSLQSELLVQPKAMTTNLSKRKIVTITEDDEYDLHPKFSKDSRKPNSVKTSSRSVGTDFKEQKQTSQRNTSRLSNSSKYSKETKLSAKISNVPDGKDPKPKLYSRNKQLNTNHVSVDNTRSGYTKDKDKKESVRISKSVNASRTSVAKNVISPSESKREVALIKSKLYDNLKSVTPKKPIEKSRVNQSPNPQAKTKTFLKELHSKHKPVTVIHVPLDEKYRKNTPAAVTPVTNISAHPSEFELVKSDCATITELVTHKDINISTDPLPEKVDSVTEMNQFEPQLIYKCVQSTDVQTELIKETFDSLKIPNVTLTKDKGYVAKEESHSLHSKSLPNLQVPQFKFTSNKNALDTNYHKSTSYIISRATLTYTTKQKIDVHVVGSNDDAYSNQSPSPMSYPINVVSVFKKESADSSNSIVVSDKDEAKSSKDYKNRINDIKSLDCSYLDNSDKLMKPSDIISTIRVNNGPLRSEYISEQFQRELNFIDSFFESLQYLESCSLSEKCYKNDKIDSFIKHPELLESELDVKSFTYDNFFSKLENGANTEDTETMASKNLFLLNILIRDEQRRAKNLLFVLKRREDALKDFTKSQILYLENKKKQENTDISALKKKQRGALLKLQHECGEMQRMRKALLTLSERRKLTLMKTKKDLELKLKNNVDVDKILLGKKKPKRNASVDRSSPLKCFDLSSSGCDDSSTSRRNSVERVSQERAYIRSSAEKSIQTGDSIVGATSTDRMTSTAAENFIIVDGGYLNIIFHNLSLPQIFSGGKEYEVNENALRHIVDSSTSQNNLNGVRVETLMDQITNRDIDRCSTPSTARSLVEEFDQYYRGLDDCESSPAEEDYRSSSTVCELSDVAVQVETEVIEGRYRSASTMTTDSNETIVGAKSLECACELDFEKDADGREVPVGSPTGPLTVPADAAAVVDTSVADAPSWFPAKSSSNTTFTDSSTASSQSLCELVSSVSSLTAPAQLEAEELRRQQLAIEKEIKELEQQQCRLLVVREIPDKPPPPYKPPAAETRISKLPRKFEPDDVTEARIRVYMSEPDAEPYEPTDSFDAFVHDFCREALDRQRQDRSDRPWDACNLLPPKPEPDSMKLVKTTSAELDEVLAGAKPTVVSGVSSRRSDHIDDILFAEWRRVEPEWTSLHTDEAIVKNQIFESIFQRILTDTVDEYKRTVLCDPVCDSC